GDVGPDGVVVLRPSNRYAVQGAVGLGVLALAAAVATSKVALAVFVPVVLIGAWLAWRQAHWLDRWVPRIVPRGRIMGALLMLVLLAVASVAVVNPARDWVRNRGQVRDAVNLSIQAEGQLNAGDLAGARGVGGLGAVVGVLGREVRVGDGARVRVDLRDHDLLGGGLDLAELGADLHGLVDRGARPGDVARVQLALGLDREVDGVADLAAVADPVAAQNAYDRAEAAYAARDWQEAIDGFTALGGFADAPARLAAVRADAAKATLARAKAALAAGDATAAFERYSDAVVFDPQVADRAFVKRIADALSGS
ncbi:MAG: hypothetical protein ACKOSO_07290, partial [Actinomycetota bacterium]